jgi:hypothetical protein
MSSKAAVLCSGAERRNEANLDVPGRAPERVKSWFKRPLGPIQLDIPTPRGAGSS